MPLLPHVGRHVGLLHLAVVVVVECQVTGLVVAFEAPVVISSKTLFVIAACFSLEQK